ncbi:glycosyltransferase family 4 protein [Litoreibacter roseus]|uniref:Glycosyl transferase family 1 n=1 Tax=Litoreibacter roseus TaxID=2601869 RepID=A0A6N6JHG3_9RHOB|nr:glycosyltransferase family 4 protein [Litoreibacter roseus]GFE65771.1 glycosyl transferase family 1 [Litoreibacter roseus]
MADTPVRIDDVDVIAPNFKRRLSGVTATVVRLVPLQAKDVAIAAACPVPLTGVPQVSLGAVLTMSRRRRVWHARRNVEMLAGLFLKHVLRKDLKLLFTSASQRHHTGLTKWLIAQMDRVVATSHKTAGYLNRDADVIYHGIDTQAFCPPKHKAALRHSIGLPRTETLIGCYGRIRAQKGTDVFVDALLRVLPDHPDLTGLVMGRALPKDQDFLAEQKAKVAAAGASHRILFLPEVPVWEMAKWYQALDIYVAPQRWEGFGLTPLEAMSCGVPAIATRVGAFEELIKAGETGDLVYPGDPDQMATKLKAALDAPEALADWSEAARAHVVAEFPLQKEAEKLVEIYRALLSSGKQTGQIPA